MTAHSVTVNRKGNTVELKIDDYITAYDVQFMSKGEIFECIKWAAITANFPLDDETLIRLTQEAMA